MLASSENATASASAPSSSPATPSTYTMGPNTAMVVSVEAVIARCTSSAPSAAAAAGPRPLSRCRKMFSSTTMELSISIPTPSASPPRLSRLSDTPAAWSSAKVAIREMGMASATAMG